MTDYVFQFSEVFRYWDWIISGIGMTIAYSLVGIILSLVLGFLGALAVRSRVLVLRILVKAYVELIRNTPFFIQLLILFFGLASVGFRLNGATAAMIGLTLYNGAFMVEIIRAGLGAIHPSQIEAGLSIGMSRPQIFYHVVMIPALEKVYPALSSQFVLLMLSTSVLSTIGVEELTNFAGQIQAINFRSIEVYLVIIMIYMALTLIIRAGARSLGRYLFRYRRLTNREAVI